MPGTGSPGVSSRAGCCWAADMARLLLQLIAAAALCSLGQSVRSRKGAAASSEQPTEASPPPSTPATPSRIEGGTTKAGKSEIFAATVKGTPIDYDLVYAIDDDSMEDLMTAIETGALVNGCDATMTAYASGHYKQINTEFYVPRRVAERVHDSMRVAEDGLTPLHYMMLRSCPLLLAAKTAKLWPGPPNLDIMRVLLEHGASPNLQTHRSGRTPLMLAAAFGFTEAVELMLEFGANVNLRSTWGDRDAAGWAEHSSHDGLIGGHYELARHLRDPETSKAARERSRHVVLHSNNTVSTENGCVCKLLWEDDDGQTQVSCPPSERWCEVEAGCEAAKEQTDEYDGWDECSAERNIRDVL